jgi:DNA polymerase-1
LQNIPRKETRKGFIAPSGELVLSADYSQIELRIMAHLSGDENLIQSFKNGEDIHRKTASLVFNIPESMVSKEERRRAKVVNFGIIYGMGPYGLSNRLGISVNQAQEFINSYFLVYPGVKNWIEKTIEKVHSDGWVETILGRRRYFEGNLRNFDERAAINAPVQGSAADLIKLAMLAIDKEIEGTKTKMVLQVHDELVFEVPESDIEEIKEIVKDRMENAIPLKVPVICDIGIGKNWYEAH